MMGVKVVQHSYHCDNGRFADDAFKQSVAASNQTITYCGINAHFQNGRAEQKIRDLREESVCSTQLLHAINRWQGAVTINLSWSYALRYASDVQNLLPTASSLLCHSVLSSAMIFRRQSGCEPQHLSCLWMLSSLGPTRSPWNKPRIFNPAYPHCVQHSKHRYGYSLPTISCQT